MRCAVREGRVGSGALRTACSFGSRLGEHSKCLRMFKFLVSNLHSAPVHNRTISKSRTPPPPERNKKHRKPHTISTVLRGHAIRLGIAAHIRRFVSAGKRDMGHGIPPSQSWQLGFRPLCRLLQSFTRACVEFAVCLLVFLLAALHRSQDVSIVPATVTFLLYTVLIQSRLHRGNRSVTALATGYNALLVYIQCLGWSWTRCLSLRRFQTIPNL